MASVAAPLLPVGLTPFDLVMLVMRRLWSAFLAGFVMIGLGAWLTATGFVLQTDQITFLEGLAGLGGVALLIVGALWLMATGSTGVALVLASIGGISTAAPTQQAAGGMAPAQAAPPGSDAEWLSDVMEHADRMGRIQKF